MEEDVEWRRRVWRVEEEGVESREGGGGEWRRVWRVEEEGVESRGGGCGEWRRVWRVEEEVGKFVTLM